MKRNKFIFTFALVQLFFLGLANVEDLNGQTHSVVKPISHGSSRTSSSPFHLGGSLSTRYLPKIDMPKRQDDQPSPSDIQLQDPKLNGDEVTQGRSQRPEFGAWPRKGIRGISIDIREQSTKVPDDRSKQLASDQGSKWSEFNATPKVFAWTAPDIRYQPLYFEDVALERYGQTAGPYQQSARSAIHMFKSFVLLPNQMRHDSPGSCDSPLGFCRPGNSVPYTQQQSYFGRPR